MLAKFITYNLHSFIGPRAALSIYRNQRKTWWIGNISIYIYKCTMYSPKFLKLISGILDLHLHYSLFTTVIKLKPSKFKSVIFTKRLKESCMPKATLLIMKTWREWATVQSCQDDRWLLLPRFDCFCCIFCSTFFRQPTRLSVYYERI